MHHQNDVDADQRAAVDQSAEVRDPADDSGLLDDPTALADTYPDVFNDSAGAAEQAIEVESRSAHSPLGQSRSTDNDRDQQVPEGGVVRS